MLKINITVEFFLHHSCQTQEVLNNCLHKIKTYSSSHSNNGDHRQCNVKHSDYFKLSQLSLAYPFAFNACCNEMLKEEILHYHFNLTLKPDTLQFRMITSPLKSKLKGNVCNKHDNTYNIKLRIVMVIIMM